MDAIHPEVGLPPIGAFMDQSIAFITDLHLDEPILVQHGVDARANWQKILGDVSSRGIGKVVLGGDLGEKEAYPWIFDSLKELELDLVLGNHDRCHEVMEIHRPALQQNPDEMYYSREDETYRYLFMDSSSAKISETQFEWFKQLLDSPKSLVIFIHHPILAIETEVDRLHPLEGRQSIVAELQKLTQKTTVFCGHYHMPDERTSGQIEQMVTPAVSFQIIKDAEPLEINTESFGYRIIHFGKHGVTTETVSF